MKDILMPRLSDTMTEGTISVWHKQPGDQVSPGDLLVEIESDKAVMEQEAYDAGTLVEHLVPSGGRVDIGQPIARLDDGREGSPVREEPPDTRQETRPLPVSSTAERPLTNAPPESASDHSQFRASPLVRRLAREQGIDLNHVTGTGPGGRIVRADLATTPARSPSTASASDTTPGADADRRDPRAIIFDPVRRVVAERLTLSATAVPSFTVTVAADVRELLSLRASVNTAYAEQSASISINDLMVRAAALALRLHPEVNSSYSPDAGGQTLQHGRIHVGIAVASPAGLVVPVVHDADRLAVSTISTVTKRLIARASERELSSADTSDGTFTISNLGMYGVEQFTALLNPPQGAILAVGAAQDEVELVGDAVSRRTVVRLTLTADHRIIDGALAAQFLASLKGLLEHPLRIVT